MIGTVPMPAADVMNVLRGIPYPVRRDILLLLLDNRDAALGGGAVRDTITGDRVKDYDVFCQSEAQAKRMAQAFLNGGQGQPVRTLNAWNAKREGVEVQFVFYRAFTSAADLVSQFDFRACAAAVYFDRGWKGICVSGFYEDCRAKRLTFLHQPKDAGSLVPLRRALKMAAKGWQAPDEAVAGILEHWTPLLKLRRKATRRALKPSGYSGRR